MTTQGVTDINRSSTDCPGASMELSTDMIRLEHVPVWLNNLTHPHTVVGTMNHMNTLQPVHSIRVAIWILEPKIIPYNNNKNITNIRTVWYTKLLLCAKSREGPQPTRVCYMQPSLTFLQEAISIARTHDLQAT